MNKESFKRKIRILKRKKWPVAVTILLIVAIICTPVGIRIVNDIDRFSPKNTLAYSKIFIKKADRSKITLIGHRGFSAQAPENTVASIRTAGKYGFSVVELDIRRTKDGVWVLSHDSDVKNTTDKSGQVSSYTYFDLITCNIDKGAHYKDYDVLKIPSLEQALKACLESNVSPMLDIKDYSEDSIDALLELVNKNGFTQSCSIVSDNRKVLELIREKNPDIKLYAVVDKLTDKETELCLKDKTIGVSFNADRKINTDGKVRKLIKANIPLVCQTVDDGEAMKKYYEMGVTDFVTNRIYPM